MLLKYVPVQGIREIRDPFGGTTQDYERALDLIESGCAGLLEQIGKEARLPGRDAPGDGRGRAQLRVVHSRD
jgi:hypothetical protein